MSKYFSAGKWSQCLKTVLEVIYKKFGNESLLNENHSSGFQQIYEDKDDATEQSTEGNEVRK